MCIDVIDARRLNPLNPLNPTVSEYAKRLYGWNLSLTLTISESFVLYAFVSAEALSKIGENKNYKRQET